MNAIDHEWLVERFKEREGLDPMSNSFAYESGRIDEFCAQNAVTDEDRELAIRQAQRELRAEAVH